MIGAAQLVNKRLAAFAVSGFAVTAAISSRQTAHAEDLSSFSGTTYRLRRKPIYDTTSTTTTPVEPPATAPQPATPAPAESVISQLPRSELLDSVPPIPSVSQVTDRLADEIKRVRMHLYDTAARAEDKTNEAISRVFRLESRVSDRIAALAPSPASAERVGSGLLTTVVATMASSIFIRNRNILLRSTIPVVVALVTANAVIPETMGNVNNLILDIEGKVSPEWRAAHVDARDRVSQFIATGIAHSRSSVDMLEQKIGDARVSLAEWVKGRKQ